MTFRASARHARWWPLALLGLAVPGCGNNPYPTGESGQSVLYTSMADDPRTLDPGRSYRADEGTILDVVCSSYYQYNYLKRPFKLELMLGATPATRAPYTFVDPETKKRVTTGELWTFRIRQDLRFQDDPCFPNGKGRNVTGADFIYALRRAADPAVTAPSIGFFGDKILGFNEIYKRNSDGAKAKPPQKADYTTPLEGLQFDPKDPYTFRIALNQSYPQMKYIMAMHFSAPVPVEAVKTYGTDLGHHPIGCGPYIIQEWTPKRRIILTKNPNRPKEFYPKSGETNDRKANLLVHAGEQLPLTDKIVFTTMKESVTGWNLFLQGYMDSWGVGATNYQQAISQQGTLSPAMKEQGVRLTKATDVGVSYYVFNMEDPVIGGYTPQKRKLRQAISLAINSQESINIFSQGLGVPAQNVLPPGIFGYDPQYKNPYRQYDPSLTKAKQLLKEAGYPDGIDTKSGQRLTLYYDNGDASATGRQFVLLLKRQVEALGVTLQERDWRDVAWQDNVDKGKFQIIHYGWLADYPDAENFMFLLYGPNKRPGPNVSAYNSPTYNKLFEKMRAMDDGPQRLAIIKQMRNMLQEDCPLIWDAHSEALSLAQEWLSPGKPMAIGNNSLKYRYIDGAKREEQQVTWNAPHYLPLLAAFGVLALGSLPAVAVVKNRHNRRITRSSSPESKTH